MTYTPNQPVRFTASHLGLIADEFSSRFEAEIVEAGWEGTYLKPHPELPDWHLIQVEMRGMPEPQRTLLCPCHESDFEVV